MNETTPGPHDSGERGAGDTTDGCELTILMPCLNEAETIGACVKIATAYLQKSGVDGEVLVADNGSTDGSRDIAAAAGARVVAVEGRGYGRALRGGIAAARGRYVIMGDADESYDFAALDPFVRRDPDGHTDAHTGRSRYDPPHPQDVGRGVEDPGHRVDGERHGRRPGKVPVCGHERLCVQTI